MQHYCGNASLTVDLGTPDGPLVGVVARYLQLALIRSVRQR